MKFKMATAKKVRFSKSPILNIFCENLMIDAKGIGVAQPILSCDCPT